jgi:glycosyltransferase involved in cell wall biosynthesis
MALIEAQSQGLPAIGFDIDGVRDIIRHGYNGFLIKDIHELDHIIDKISDDSKLLKTMSEHSRRNIKEYFIDEIYFPHLIHIYSSL